MSRRAFTRPRTKVYDCNYSMGEGYYRSTVDSLDRKSRTVGPAPVQEGIAPPEPPTRVQRPLSAPDLDAVVQQANKSSEQELLNEEMTATLKRIRAARAAEIPTPEANFENAFAARREAVKQRFSEKMLDTVGINGSLTNDEVGLTIRRRAVRREPLVDEVSPVSWTVMRTGGAEEALESSAAASRALRSRARLADLEAEMDEIAERGAAREARLRSLRSLVNQDTSSASSLRVSKKSMNITENVSTEKRTIAY